MARADRRRAAREARLARTRPMAQRERVAAEHEMFFPKLRRQARWVFALLAIIFAVDFIPIQALFWRSMPDSWLDEWETSLKRVLAMDWDKLIPGHPGPGGRLGNKQDVENLLQYMADLSVEVKKVADEGKCYDAAMKEVKLPKYESWGNYGNWLAGNVERYCFLYRSGF